MPAAEIKDKGKLFFDDAKAVGKTARNIAQQEIKITNAPRRAVTARFQQLAVEYPEVTVL